MFGLFRKTEPEFETDIVTLRIKAPIQPMDRFDVYEEPLSELLSQTDLGEVVGGGTMLGEAGIEYCDIEVALPEAEPRHINALVHAVEALGAPRGSTLIIEATGEERPFGRTEGLAVILDGTGLPDEVYEVCDLAGVIDGLNAALDGAGRYQSYANGDTETWVYLYGASADVMEERIAGFLEEYPLCENARVERLS